jgi:hypothetical protein
MPFDRAQTIFPIWNSSIYPRHISISITLIITILLLTNNILGLVCSIIGDQITHAHLATSFFQPCRPDSPMRLLKRCDDWSIWEGIFPQKQHPAIVKEHAYIILISLVG